MLSLVLHLLENLVTSQVLLVFVKIPSVLDKHVHEYLYYSLSIVLNQEVARVNQKLSDDTCSHLMELHVKVVNKDLEEQTYVSLIY